MPFLDYDHENVLTLAVYIRTSSMYSQRNGIIVPFIFRSESIVRSYQTQQNPDLGVFFSICTATDSHFPLPTTHLVSTISLLATFTNDIVRIVNGTECHSHQGESASC